MNRKKIIPISLIVVIITIFYLFYNWKISTTNIATLNFPDFTVEKFIRSNNNSFINIEPVALDEVDDILNYDMVMIRIHGSSMNKAHLDAIKKAISKGIPVFSTEQSNVEINSLTGLELQYISTLMENGSVANYSSIFNYIRKNIDNKILFNKSYSEPLVVPNDYFFHLGDDQFFSTYEQYQQFYEKSGRYKNGAPRIALLSGNINMQNSNEEHIAAIINSLEKRGLNVYPINSFGAKKLELIADMKPDLIINRPHGRLVMGGAESGTELLKKLNVPIMAPLTVSEPYDKWLKNRQGMASGGMTSMSVVLPELDGAIAPFAIAAQFERGGMNIFDAIPKHTEKFCSLVDKFIKLQTKKNSEKKIAIYYYKGAGKGALSAAEIEGVQSLYNTLKLLKKSGYKVDGLPKTIKAFEALIQRQGSVLGSYAMGAYDTFLKEGNPALVETSTFYDWADDILHPDMVQQMRDKYGEAPGDYMGVERDGKKYIAVARIQFGNVTILPQPLPSTGENSETIVHGVDGAVAYPYVASYFWSRKAFGADALIHFGTHGSLEFIPGKQVALSDYDWTDALIGDIPHFYIYTINNIGEGIIAKRRSYATLVSHLTAPFMQSDLYDELEMLKDKVHRFEHLEAGQVRESYRESITESAMNQNIHSALSLDSTKLFDDKSIDKVHIYLEEISAEKVADGLYTLGVEYTEENLDNTARLMSIDAIKYSFAALDLAHGRITTKQMDNISFMVHKYDRKANNIIHRALKGENSNKFFSTLVSKSDLELFNKAITKEKAIEDMRNKRVSAMMSAPKKELPKFLDSEGVILTKSSNISKMEMMSNMVSGDIDREMILSMLGDVNEQQAVYKIKSMISSGGHGSMIKKSLGVKTDEEAVEIVRKMIREKQGAADKKPETSMMDRMAKAEKVDTKSENSTDKDIVEAVRALKEAVTSIYNIRMNLLASTELEERSLLNALNGGYIHPSSAGDPIVNPKAVPTGRNFYSINPETTPTPEAWKVGRRLAENILEAEMTSKGRYPKKVSFTLWSSDFISSEGATIAQILYLLGVEPLRDGFGYIRSLKLIPANELGRPRIDVVVQTSGQLRDIAASRLALINRAIEMAAEDKSEDNYVSKGFKDAEKALLEKGFSPADARKYSRQRVFGGANGSYGTGIMSMVEKGDSWEDRSEIATKYIEQMSGIYTENGGEGWGEVKSGVFEAALLNTEVVIQPRSSNTWGALSLDHVYEFMGGLSAAVEHVTGEDPTAYFNDFRNSSRAKVQGLKEAIGVESNSTVFNPKYIREMMKGEASALGRFAEVFRNTFGWNAMKPSVIDQHLWNRYYDIYVKDEYKMGLEKSFSEKNPYAMQEMTAVMLESARKGMWEASEQQLKDVAKLHTKFVDKHEAGCSGFVCDNAKLREFITKQVDKKAAEKYNKAIDMALQVQLDEEASKNSVVLEKEKQNQMQKENAMQIDGSDNKNTIWIIIGVIIASIVAIQIIRRKSNKA